MFTFIDDTYQDLGRYNFKLHNYLNGSQLMQTINKYKNGCNEVYAKTLESYNMCHKLGQNIVRTIDIFKELCTCLSDLEEYNYRLCEIMSIFIVCELRLSVDATQQEQILIAQRIIYIMRRHLVQEEEHETLHNILRTLVFIPKLFNARDIMCAIFGEFIPIKPVLGVKVLPDKLYMLYIIIFYRWMMMQKEDDDKMLIVNFAESFMKPSVSLCSNNLYCSYLPIYTTHSTATRTILTNLKYYRDLRNASIIDNALKKIGTVVNLCDDEEDDDIIVLDTSPTTDFAEVFASARVEPLRDSMSNIKLDEKTVVSMVDLTEEDEPVKSETSISERHDKWLNDFQSLAKRYRESQILWEKQQNNNLISNGEKHTVICLDSDSEEEDDNSATVSKETSTLATSSQQNNSEDLFVDNYPPTNTPINCSSALDSLDAKYESHVTKISPRFLAGALRTYQAKKNCLSEARGKNDYVTDEANKAHGMYEAYRRNSIHISSTPPDRPQTEGDDSTSVSDENENRQTYTHLLATRERRDNGIVPKQVQPMGPCSRYDKIVFSHDAQHQQKYQDKKCYRSDCSEIKTPKKQKKKVHFNTSLLEPNAFSASQKTSLKSILHQPKYKASDATSKTEESTNEKFIYQTITHNVKKYKHYYKCSNIGKNVSVFKQKSLSMNTEEKSIRNVKIHLKKLRLDKDVSLTKFKNNFISKKQTHTTTFELLNKNLDNSNTNPTSPIVKNKHEDDIIFKKPLPVAKKVFKSPKHLKIQNIVSLRTHPNYFRRKETIKATRMGIEIDKSLDDKITPDIEKQNKLEVNTSHDVGFSRTSKMLTKEINSLSCETVDFEEIKEVNGNEVQYNKEFQKEKELSKYETEVTLQSNLVVMTCSRGKLEAKADTNIEEAKKQERYLLANIEETKKELADERYNIAVLSKELVPNKNNETSSNNLANIKSKENSSVYSEPSDIKDSSSKLNRKKKRLSIKKEKLINENLTDETESISQANKEQTENKINNATTNKKLVVNPNYMTQDTQTSNLQIEDNTKLNYSKKIIRNSTGLRNEPSPPTNDTGEREYDTKKNILSTPTMCSIDLDVVSETIIPTKECATDKLLEDFDNKTEDIVGTDLNKHFLDCEATSLSSSYISPKSSNSKNISSIVFSKSDGTLHDNENKVKKVSFIVDSGKDVIGNKDYLMSKSMKKEKVPSFAHKCLKSNKNIMTQSSSNYIGLTDLTESIFKESKNISVNKSDTNQAKDISLAGEQNKESKTKNISKQEEIKEPTSEKKLKKLNKGLHPKANSDPCAKIEHSTKDEKIPTQQMEASINENQHMTVELGNWKQERQNETKTNESEASGVSAIFSFPKIPIISISIRTTPNNKTYFKISNRENGNQGTEVGKVKKIKSTQLENEGRTINEEKTITNSCLDANDVKSKAKATQSPVGESKKEDDDDEAEKEEGEDDEEEDIDNFEIEKFSHDSNSACSLPLKKRPTQAEPNDDAEDSQLVTSGSYEQRQETAAEVVIENSCKNKTQADANTLLTLCQEVAQNNDETEPQDVNSETPQEIIHVEENCNFLSDFDDNKTFTSPTYSKKLSDPSSPFKRRVHIPIRSVGQTPIQIVAPQLKDNSSSPPQDYWTEAQIPIQTIQPLPESYPATPMLSVANVEKLMDFNRFIEELLVSPDVMTIIDNANACGYYAEGHTYEMERIAILEHYNIANAKGNSSVTKPLYWKKSAGDTISIFNDNDNEWISLPPSTSKQLQKLSFVLSILQQQYKVTDVRQRINIALTFLIRNTSKYKNDSNSSLLLKRISYFRIATNNEALSTNFDVNSNTESAKDFHATNFSSKTEQNTEMALQHEPATNNNQSWNNTLQFASSGTGNVMELTNCVRSPQRLGSSTIECEHHQQQTPKRDKRNSSLDELNNEIYINPPCATSPQNEVIVNTNGVELHEMPQDQQNIFISITDEAGTVNGNPESSLHKYNIKQQQQIRALDDGELLSSLAQKSYGKRPCLANNGGVSLMSNHFMSNAIISAFGNQEINLQNPYRTQQHHMTSQNVNTTSVSSFPQRNISPQNTPINIYNNNIHSSSLPTQQQLQLQQRIPNRFTTSFNTQLSANSPQIQTKHNNESNYKEILQPYITYLIKDHEKTSKHLLQVFEEVSNSNTQSGPDNNNLNQTLPQNHQQFNSLLPPLIRNPQQNHMPGLQQMPGSSGSSVLPSLIRNPHQCILTNSDSGALQVVQSFLEQSQATFDAVQQQKNNTEQPQQQQQQNQQTASSHPGFAKEYVNFVGCRDELAQKSKLRNFNMEKQQEQKQLQQQQQQQQKLSEQRRQETQRLNSVKRKCQERNDKLAEDLKRKMVEFSLLKHNVHIKQLESQQKQRKCSSNKVKTPIVASKRRGRPRKITKVPLEDNAISTMLSNTDNISNSSYLSPKDKSQNKCNTRVTRRNQTNSNSLTPPATVDHPYFRQRSAAREAAKRINATMNSHF